MGPIGAGDNYYALGGDSISAIQIASTAQDAGLPLAAIDIFEHLTIEALASHLAARRESAPDEEPGRSGENAGAVFACQARQGQNGQSGGYVGEENGVISVPCEAVD